MIVLRLATAIAFAVFVSPFAQAQNYPDRPIKLIAPFPAIWAIDRLLGWLHLA